jgi:Tfp pilus assembly protein PilN
MLEQYYRINQVIGVNINHLPGGNTEVNACAITVDKNQLTFDKKITGLAGTGQLKKDFTGKYVALNISGRGILQKQVELIDEINPNGFNKIFPNANMDDFYVQNFRSGTKSFVSIIRRDEADKWIRQIKELGYIPLMLSLGPFPVQNIVTQLNSYDNGLVFDGNTVTFNEKQEWLSCQYAEKDSSPFPYKVESETIEEKLLIAYASAFQLALAENIQPISASVAGLQTELETLLANKKLRVKVGIILVIFFILLLVNFLVFSSLSTANNQLTEKVSQTAQSSINIQSVNDRIKQKEALLNTLGWDGGVNKSALIDQVASLLPEGVTLDEIAINPVDVAQSRIQKAPAFASRQIHITGYSANIIPVNEWIARIKTKPWVKAIQLDNYTFNNELNTGQFTVIINY